MTTLDLLIVTDDKDVLKIYQYAVVEAVKAADKNIKVDVIGSRYTSDKPDIKTKRILFLLYKSSDFGPRIAPWSRRVISREKKPEKCFVLNYDEDLESSDTNQGQDDQAKKDQPTATTVRDPHTIENWWPAFLKFFFQVTEGNLSFYVTNLSKEYAIAVSIEDSVKRVMNHFPTRADPAGFGRFIVVRTSDCENIDRMVDTKSKAYRETILIGTHLRKTTPVKTIQHLNLYSRQELLVCIAKALAKHGNITRGTRRRINTCKRRGLILLLGCSIFFLGLVILATVLTPLIVPLVAFH